jgi:hypothetical protein
VPSPRTYGAFMPDRTHLLIVGGGPAALEAALAVKRLAGDRPRYLRHAPHARGLASDDAPWWQPHKIAGRELAPYLTAHPELRLEPVNPTL